MLGIVYVLVESQQMSCLMCLVLTAFNRHEFCFGECPDRGLAYRVQQRWILQAVWLSQGRSDAEKQYLQVFMFGLVLVHDLLWCIWGKIESP